MHHLRLTPMASLFLKYLKILNDFMLAIALGQSEGFISSAPRSQLEH